MAPGTYQDTLTDMAGCDSVIFEISYSYFDPQQILVDAPPGFCEGGSATLTVSPGHSGISWAPSGSLGSVLTTSSSGTFTATGTDANGCTVSASVDVEEWPVPTVATDDLLDTLFRAGLSLPASYFGSIDSYAWSPSPPLDCGDCPYPQLQLPEGGDYGVTVTNAHGCTATGTVRVSFKDSDVYVPNAIRNSPNEAVNGVLFAQSNNDFLYSLKVFDRWGGLRYEADGLRANDPTQGWRPDGGVDPGVFTWMVLFNENGKKRVLAGDVTVL
ncbi:MAG: hypothetical protein R2825_25235 [Saprospiraceae bacterium]